MVRLSIITINLNNSLGLQKTMSSVFSQSFFNFEYIVIDGGSEDDSTTLIKSKDDKIDFWISEKDTGVYNAMNKGIAKASGEYLLFLNSGDSLINDDVLSDVVKELDGTGIVYGNLFFIESDHNSYTAVYPNTLSFQHFVEGSLPHPGSFIKRTLFNDIGYYDEGLKIISDWKFFLNAICSYNVSYKHIDKTISAFCLNGISSLTENKNLIENEKQTVFLKEYPAFIQNSYELTQLRTFKNNKLIAKFTKIAKSIGLLKKIKV